MYVIYAEKPDIGTKIAIALADNGLDLGNGTILKSHNDAEKCDKVVKAIRTKNKSFSIKIKGEDVIVTWGFGHLCELRNAKGYDASYGNWRNLPVPFFPDKWELDVSESTKEQFKYVKSVCAKADYIISATDDDREGELLWAYVYEKMNVKTPYKYRMVIDATNEQGLRDSFNHLKDATLCKNTENAGRGRSIADAAIGYNCTAQLTLKKGTKKGEVLSVGRCVTPTLNMLVTRELDIRNFKPEDYYVLEAVFGTGNTKFKGEHINGRFSKKKDAEDILNKINGHKGVVKSVDKKRTFKESQGLYNIDLLQMDANSKYGLTLDATSKIAQELYDKGYTTYPRTDSCFLTDNMEPEIHKVLDVLSTFPEYEDLIVGKTRTIPKARYFNSSKVTGHYAIIPTGVIPKNLSPNEQKIYDLISRSVISMIYSDAIVEKTSVIIDVDGQEFKSSGTTIVDDGWYKVLGYPKETIIPNLAQNDIIDGTYSLLSKKTEPPKRYSDKTLLTAMINAGKEIQDKDLKKFMQNNKIEGIGRPSTRAAIVKRLIDLQYAKRTGKSIQATDKGIELIQSIPFEEIKSAELTAKWEQRLADIEAGKERLDVFIKDIKALTTDWCNKIIKIQGNVGGRNMSNTVNGVVCPQCGGAINKFDWGYGCAGYKNGCKFSISGKICNHTVTEDEVRDILNNGKTNTINNFKLNAGEKFSAQLELQEENGVYKVWLPKRQNGNGSDDEAEYTCPECGKPMRLFDWGYGCSGYRDGCKFSVGKTAYGKKLTDEQIRELFENGVTSEKVTGLDYKGTKFDAYLEIRDGSVRSKKDE